MKKFTGKKLLILGANPETSAIVKKANEMGIYTIVTDYNPNAPAKKIASKSYDVDCLNVKSLVNLARSENIDGVIVGVADVLIPAYQELCDILKMPCYGNKLQVNIFSNKFNFKRICEKYNVKGIPEYVLDANSNIPKNIKYPVLVKPVDNCSGKGMTVCNDNFELLKGINKATLYSRSKKYIIERFMNCDDMIIYYTFKDGYYSVSMIGDRYTCSNQIGVSPVCLADCFPSKHTKLYFETMHSNICNMFHDIGVINGILLIQAFVEDDNIYVYDPGFRLQGCAPHLVINNVNGFNQIEMLIEFALTGSMGDVDLKKEDDYMLKGKTAGSLWFLLNDGIIGTIEGVVDLQNDSRIINILQRFQVGDVITPEMVGTEQQVFARLHIVCNSKEEYMNTITEMQDKIKVYDTNGNNMIVQGVDVSKL